MKVLEKENSQYKRIYSICRYCGEPIFGLSGISKMNTDSGWEHMNSSSFGGWRCDRSYSKTSYIRNANIKRRTQKEKIT